MLCTDGKYGKVECETIEFVSEDVIGFGRVFYRDV